MENLANSSDFLQTNKIADAMKRRFDKDRNYTYIGDMLLAVNPTKVPLEDVESSEPHIVNMCRNIHKKMLHFQKNELLVPSGFEGTGRENVYDVALETLLSYGRIPLVTEKISAADKILSALVRKAF